MRKKRYDISDKAFNVYIDSTIKCKHCGHSLLFGNKEKIICNHCGYYVYRNSKIEFKHKILTERLKH